MLMHRLYLCSIILQWVGLMVVIRYTMLIYKVDPVVIRVNGMDRILR